MTDQYAVIGNPIEHSLSPSIHALFGQSLKHDIEYKKICVELDDFDRWVKNFFEEGGKGLNITVPFKINAFELADQQSERTLLAGAANTLGINEDGTLWADNTDGIGLARDISSRLNHSLTDAHIIILGAGGAVRGVVGELLKLEPASLTIANRTPEKAVAIADQLNDPRVSGCGLNNLSVLPAPDWVISGLSTGLNQSLPDLPSSLIADYTHTYDMIYSAKATPFQAWSKSLGAVASYDGLGMLVEQAAESYRLWRGEIPATEPVLQHLRSLLAKN